MYHRFILLANPLDGAASLSWRAKGALENLGHIVFWFTPERHPFLFEAAKEGEANESGQGNEGAQGSQRGQGGQDSEGSEGNASAGPTLRVNLDSLAKFLERQQPDGLITADGVVLTDEQRTALQQLSPATVVLPLEHLTPQPLVDQTYLTAPLANTIAYPPRLMCLEEATPQRIEALRQLEGTAKELKLPIRCLGSGWPQEWRIDPGVFHWLAYTSRSAVARIQFADNGPQPNANLEALAEADGAPIIVLGDSESESSATTTAEALRALVAEDLPREAQRFPRNTSALEDGATLEAELERTLARLVTLTAPEKPSAAEGAEEATPAAPAATPAASALPGTPSPRTIVSILGYFGMGNYGDEYILATLDERLRATVPGSSIVAISENPRHTLEQRGIYALSLKDIIAVDRALAFASAALVVAGLLFDQGIRWTAGKAEAFTSIRVSDIPGIAAYASLAAANDTPLIFHGIGAGPLEVLDGRQLVKLLGKQGALFTPRDQETADLLRSCGVPESQVIECADTIFLNTIEGEKRSAQQSVTPEETPEKANAGDEGARTTTDNAGTGTPNPDAGTESGHLDSALSPFVAISLREYENTPVDFPARMARTLDAVATAHPELAFTFCILDPGDLKLSQAVTNAMEHAEHCRIFEYDNNLDALTELLRSAQAGFSMRYHSALVMSAFGIPCVGMDYLPKVASLYADLGVRDLLVPPTATTEQCTTALLSALDDAATWRSKLAAGIAPLQAGSQRAFDLLLENIAATSPSKQGAIPQEFFLHTKPAPQRRQTSLEKQLTAAKDDAATTKKELAATKKKLKTARAKLATAKEAAQQNTQKLSPFARALRKLTGRN